MKFQLLQAVAFLGVGVFAAKPAPATTPPTAKPTTARPVAPTNPPTSATLGKTCTAKTAGPPTNPKIMSDSCGEGESCTIEYDDDGNLVAGVCELAKCSGMADPDVLDYTPENEASVRVTICHRTCSATNPWVRITIDDDAWEDLGNDCQAGGHKREHNVTIDCKTKIQKKADAEGISFAAARTAIWGANDADYLIKWHGTREAVRINNKWTAVSLNNAGKATFCAEEKEYWGYWERACPYVRHGQCCGTEQLGACCGNNPFPNAAITLKKYSCTAGTTCSATTVTSASCKDDLLSGTTNVAAKYCYKIENTGSMNLCSIDMTDRAWASGKATLPGCLAVGGVHYTEYSTGTKFPNAGIIIDETATVYGTPASNAGVILDGGVPVKASDPSRLQGNAPPTAAPTATPTGKPTATPTGKPTATPTGKPTATPTGKPTATPTGKPTATPTGKPTAAPTAPPTAPPTATPTGKPTTAPTAPPTATPTGKPTTAPTAPPTATPTGKPTATPTAPPTAGPTSKPTAAPTAPPTAGPTAKPTAVPTAAPTVPPTAGPTAKPTAVPTAAPTAPPTAGPTAKPTAAPTAPPTDTPVPKINIEKTSVSGSTTSTSCNPGLEMVSGTVGFPVHYCYEVTNTGNTYLSNVKVSDECNIPMSGDCGLMAPGASCRVPYNLEIPEGGENCPGNVKGTPTDKSGTPLGLPDVTDSDPSGLEEADADKECKVETQTEVLSDGGTRIITTETCTTCSCP